jgi:outer membrane protein assembly factor BamB
MIGTSVACPVARNSTHLFVAGTDKRLHAIVADEYWQQFMATADDDSPITSIIADDDFVIFSTLSGNVVSISSESPKRLWQFDVAGAITAPIVRDGNRLYVASEDTKLYKFDIHTGQSLWTAPFQAGAALKTAAVTGTEVVYQYAGQQGLYAVDKQNGRKIWHVPDGVGFLAEKGSLAYVLAKPAVLVVMDNKKGKKLYSVNFAAISNYAINTMDSKIYVADDKGRLMCIAPENADSAVESKNN